MDTFSSAFIQLSSLTVTTVVLILLMEYVIWPNDHYNAIFNNGIGSFGGWKCGESNPIASYIIFVGFQISGLCLYSISMGFCVLDYYLEKIGKLQDYKVLYPPPRPLQNKISWKLYKKSIFLAGVNQICAMIFIPILFIPLMQWRGVCDAIFFYDNQSLLYGILMVIIKFVIIPYLGDFIFYTAHRTTHEIGFLYRNIHKVHHQFVETYAISATASHPLEHLCVNLVSVLGSPLILGMPLFWFFLFVSIACIQTTLGHSGYGSPFRKYKFGNAVPHDYHHHYVNCEFGSGSQGTFDKLLATRLQDKYPKRWQQIKMLYDTKYNDQKK